MLVFFLVFVLVIVDVSKFDVLTTKVEKEALLCDISAGEESSGLLGRVNQEVIELYPHGTSC